MRQWEENAGNKKRELVGRVEKGKKSVRERERERERERVGRE